MTANELRLGNIIYRNVYDINPDGNKVYDPDGNEQEIVTIEILDSIRKGSNDYSGISLTEEWLLKFGFEKQSKYFYFNDSYRIEQMLRNVFSCKGKTDGSESHPIAILSTVHQLQNLYFALTGEELKT